MLTTERYPISNSAYYFNSTSLAMNSSVHIDSKGLNHFLRLHKAVFMANELFHREEFYTRISQLPMFDMADASPAAIATLIRNTRLSMTIDVYYALSPVKNYDGYDDPEHPLVIHLNAWKLERPAESICNTLVHSCVHAVNAQHPQYHFGHGDGASEDKRNTAPYRIGALAQEILSNGHTDVIELIHDPFETTVSEFKKIYAR